MPEQPERRRLLEGDGLIAVCSTVIIVAFFAAVVLVAYFAK